ncbi:phospholipase A2 [Dictyocaulus viviparus]|uniref:Phospholipase A2 n=1 Tax=Dictyocaulus viviparus TaxID=29172 RepID=A0A0D8Y4F9_DICVI|nr:phospholipase A2 [Dictyocaulus viviparus]
MRSAIVLYMIQILLFVSYIQSIHSNNNALWNLGEVGECVLHYFPLVYNDYGCWCGIGGAHEPVDGIDRCCMHHDKCYDAAVSKKICFDTPWEYIDNYNWKCVNSTAICDEHNHPCQAALCSCDVAVVKCWSQYPKPLKKKHCTHKKIISTEKPKFLQH